MRKHELRACPKCKRKIFVILSDESGKLVEIQYIGIKKISEKKAEGENKVFVCGLCSKLGAATKSAGKAAGKKPAKKSKFGKK